MSAIFLPEDVCELLKGKTIIYIGDSVQRSMYKDLVLLFQDKRYLTDQELRAKGELCFLGDELMEGGKKGEMNNSTKYREVRKFLYDSDTKVLYFFITACFGEYIEMLLKKLMKPDIIFMNSCLWDVHRYGSKGYEGYGPNLKKLVKLMKDLHPSVLFAWTTTPPVDIRSKAGFLENRKDLVKINEVLRCNDIARQIMKQESVPIADFADVFRHFTHHRASDGVHWNERAHRRMTNILLETVARHFNKPIPRPVSDEFSRNHDFDDRPPFPHSFSQPAFHHDNSWGSFDEDRWHYDPFMNDSVHDDFILGLDHSYGYGNYNYFETDDELPPRFMPPPHGRRMPMEGRQGPPMRPLPPLPPPPLPPGYRYGTVDSGMMRDGRKRKGRDDDIMDGYEKRYRMEDGRRYSGPDRRTPSPMVDNQSELNEELTDQDEKPVTANASEEKPAITPVENTEKDASLSKRISYGEQTEPSLQTASPVEEPANALADATAELANDEHQLPVQSLKSNKNGGSESAKIDGEQNSLNAVPIDESKENESKDNTAVQKSSVFAKLSATTTMILQSIQKSSKSIVTNVTEKSLGDKAVGTGVEVKVENDEKLRGSSAVEAVSDEKPAVTGLDETCPAEAEVSQGEFVNANEAEGIVASNDVGVKGESQSNKAKVKVISYYDTEETFEDIEASLDKMDDDGYSDSIDIDEEKLLMDEIEDFATGKQSNVNANNKGDNESMLELQAKEEEIKSSDVFMKVSDTFSNDKIVSDGKILVENALMESSTEPVVFENKIVNCAANVVDRNRNDIDLKIDTESAVWANSQPDGTHKPNPNASVSPSHVSNPSLKTVQNEERTAQTVETNANAKGTILNSGTKSPSVPSSPNSIKVIKVTSPTHVTKVSNFSVAVTVSAGSKATVAPFGRRTSNVSAVSTSAIATAKNSAVNAVELKTASVTNGNKMTILSHGSAKLTSEPTFSATAVSLGSTTTASDSANFAKAPVGKNTVQFGTKPDAPIDSKIGVSNVGISNLITPTTSSISFSSEALPKSTNLAGEKPKLPCFPNPPSLDMKSPFFRPKLGTKVQQTPNASVSPAKTTSLGSTRVSKVCNNNESMGKAPSVQQKGVSSGQQSMQPGKSGATTDSPKKEAKKKSDGTPSKEKTKEKKKKKLKKKGSKKADGVPSGKDLKGAKDGGVKKKCKKDGKVKKKKKLKDKIKGEGLSNIGVNKSSESILMNNNALNAAPQVLNTGPQNIAIIATKDRTKLKPSQLEKNFSRNTQFQSQTIAPANTQAMHCYPPLQAQNFQQQQQQQPLDNSQFFGVQQQPQQSFVPVQQPQPPNATPQFQYGQLLITNQLNPLLYTTSFNAAVDPMCGTPGITTGYQPMENSYYGDQTGNQLHTMNPQASLHQKEYAHLAWL